MGKRGWMGVDHPAPQHPADRAPDPMGSVSQIPVGP